MHLSPRELDKLILHNAGSLAQKRLARGLRLNHPEAVALIATVLLELIRDGRSVSELMNLGRQLLGRNQVMPGVPEMIYDVQVEGTFPDGSKLVTVHHPIAAEHGDLALALYGSFLPVPDLKRFTEPEPLEALPGAYLLADGEIEMNAGREAVEVAVTNLGDRPVQVGSHYHFAETNPGLRFDRTTLNPGRPAPCGWWRSAANGSFAAATIWRAARCRPPPGERSPPARANAASARPDPPGTR